MSFSLESFLIGLGCALLIGALIALILRRSHRRTYLQYELNESEQNILINQLEQNIGALQEKNEELENLVAGERIECKNRLRAEQSAHDEFLATMHSAFNGSKDSALSSCRTVASGVEELLGSVKTFERWHADMNKLIQHNRTMHGMNDDFAYIVKQMVVVTLNASIEAARAGEYGRGFSEVSKELRTLATSAQNLSDEYRRNLYENDLITTITFQDLQASGKMMTASVIVIGSENDKTKDTLSL